MSRLMLLYDEEVPQDISERIDSLARRRTKHEPLQYILGEQEFMGRSFHCRPGCLIPRQDTELLVEQAYLAIEEAERELTGPDALPVRVLDMCTGSGCIAVSMAAEYPKIRVTAADLSEAALDIAKENAALNQVDIDFVETDMFSRISGVFDLIVSNPPYIRTDIISGLMPEVREFEPMMALDGGEDGLIFYQRLCDEGLEHLRAGGCLMVEMDDDQGELISRLFRSCGLQEVKVLKDLTGADRVVVGRKPH